MRQTDTFTTTTTLTTTTLLATGLFLAAATLGCQDPEAIGAGTDEHDPSGAEAADLNLQAPRSPAYVDVQETFADDAQWTRWFELTRGLRKDFDDICGDTFCEGEFSNLEALSFRCSVSVRSGELKSCQWLFAGSSESVTPSSGRIRSVAQFFRCAIPVTGTPAALMDALLAPAGDGPLWRPLPGSSQSVYDALGACL